MVLLKSLLGEGPDRAGSREIGRENEYATAIPCGDFFHGFLYSHYAPGGVILCKRAGKGLWFPKSQNRDTWRFNGWIGERTVEVCAIPPFRDKTAEGWGTRS